MSNAIGRVLFVFNVLGLDAVVRCVDLGGIIDYEILLKVTLNTLTLLLF
jgi:hypothetical protein